MSGNENVIAPESEWCYKFSALGWKYLQNCEGLRLQSYRDSGGVWTIGYGHTGPEVKSGLLWNLDECKDAATKDLKHAMDSVFDICAAPDRKTGIKLTNNQFSALVLFVYNIGSNAFENSTLADYFDGLLVNQTPDTPIVISYMARWNKVKGQVIQGLVNRRASEAALWRTPDVS